MGTLEFMTKLYREMKKDYAEIGLVDHYCYDNALSIARFLIAEGKSPEIRKYRIKGSKPFDGQKFLVKGYEKILPFGHHMACVCEEKVYEAMFDQIIPEEEYPSELTDAELEWTLQDSTEALIKRFAR